MKLTLAKRLKIEMLDSEKAQSESNLEASGAENKKKDEEIKGLKKALAE